MSDMPPQSSPVVDSFGEENPGWPKVVGIISIVWASLGLVCGVCGMGSLIFMSALTKPAEEQMGPMPDIMKPNGIQIGIGALGFIPAIILLIAGIMTVRRSRAGAMAHIAYGAIGILLGLTSTAYMIYHQLQVQAWAQQNSTDKWAAQAGSPFAWIGVVVGVLFGLAYPAFCLAWFGVIKRNADMGSNEVSI